MRYSRYLLAGLSFTFALIAPPVMLAQASMTDNSDASTTDSKNKEDTSKFDVRANSTELFAFGQKGKNVASTIHAYTFFYPRNAHPAKITRRALKYEVESMEHKAGMAKRGIHNPVELTGTTDVNLNGHSYHRYNKIIGGTLYHFYARTEKQRVTIVRAAVKTTDSGVRQSESTAIEATTKCLCTGRC